MFFFEKSIEVFLLYHECDLDMYISQKKISFIIPMKNLTKYEKIVHAHWSPQKSVLSLLRANDFQKNFYLIVLNEVLSIHLNKNKKVSKTKYFLFGISTSILFRIDIKRYNFVEIYILRTRAFVQLSFIRNSRSNVKYHLHYVFCCFYLTNTLEEYYS